MESCWCRDVQAVRSSVHTQTATLNVKLTFVGVWVKMPDVRIVAEMSKTKFQNTMCIIITRQNKKYLVVPNYRAEVSHLASYIFNLTVSTLDFRKKSCLLP